MVEKGTFLGMTSPHRRYDCHFMRNWRRSLCGRPALVSWGTKREDVAPTHRRCKRDVRCTTHNHNRSDYISFAYGAKQSLLVQTERPPYWSGSVLQAGAPAVLPGYSAIQSGLRITPVRTIRVKKAASTLGEEQQNCVRNPLVIHLASSSALDSWWVNAGCIISPCTMPGECISIWEEREVGRG